MNVDHYAGAARRWAEGASLVYGPIAWELVGTSPHPLRGRTVLDTGAGTGVASTALAAAGARPLGADLSSGMLAWRAGDRPPAAVCDVRALSFREDGVDDTVAAFVLNHLDEPALGMKELLRVTRPGGAVLGCVFSNASRSEARDVIDAAAQREGWRVPAWYSEIKQAAAPLLGSADDMERTAKRAGFRDVVVDERPVDVGVDEPEQLVAYRLGQAPFAAWLGRLRPDEVEELHARLAEAARSVMRPYRPVVVFLVARVP